MVQTTASAVPLLYHTSVIRLGLLVFWRVCKNRMRFLSAFSSPGHFGVQNMLQELLTLTRGQVVEEILRGDLNEPAQTCKQTKSLLWIICIAQFLLYQAKILHMFVICLLISTFYILLPEKRCIRNCMHSKPDTPGGIWIISVLNEIRFSLLITESVESVSLINDTY